MNRVHEAALVALETIGLSQAIPSCVALVTRAGGTFTDEGRLLFPRSLVEDILAKARRDLVLHARDPIYEHYAAEFRRQCAKLEQLAKNSNHEGASFTYLNMTTMCIDCHNYVRESLRVAHQPGGGVQLIPSHVP